MTVDSSIFRAYDIRGIVGASLTEETARLIGRAFGMMLHEENRGLTVCTAYDGRTSSPGLEEALTTGLKQSGIHVIRLGMGPTPLLYFGTKYLEAAGGVMITGSHNPPSYNGLKMLFDDGPVYGERIRRLYDIIAADDFTPDAAGTDETRDVATTYITRLLEEAPANRNLSVIWDCGNGVTGDIVKILAKRLPGRHKVLFGEIDGTFPHHHPDPTVPENLADLIAAVAKEKADIGIAFDGDGDRIGVVDARGRIVWGDQLMALYARDILADNPGATIIADVKASQGLFDDITHHGGKALMWKTGHSLIKAKMAETRALAAGEMSGHIFFADRYYGFDDALYAALRLLSVLEKRALRLEDFLDSLPQTFYTPEIRIPVGALSKFGIIDDLKRQMQDNQAKFIDVDGIRAITKEGWWLLRASNTEEILVFRAEAQSAEGLTAICGEAANMLRHAGFADADDLISQKKQAGHG